MKFIQIVLLCYHLTYRFTKIVFLRALFYESSSTMFACLLRTLPTSVYRACLFFFVYPAANRKLCQGSCISGSSLFSPPEWSLEGANYRSVPNAERELPSKHHHISVNKVLNEVFAVNADVKVAPSTVKTKPRYETFLETWTSDMWRSTHGYKIVFPRLLCPGKGQ